MPCIQLSTNKLLTSEKQKLLKSDFGKAIEIIPGKSEKWLMCIFRPVNGMWFQGEQSGLALVEVGIFGQVEKNDCNKLTEELTRIVSSKLNIKPDYIYIQYSVTPYWGWNGKNLEVK